MTHRLWLIIDSCIDSCIFLNLKKRNETSRNCDLFGCSCRIRRKSEIWQRSKEKNRSFGETWVLELFIVYVYPGCLNFLPYQFNQSWNLKISVEFVGLIRSIKYLLIFIFFIIFNKVLVTLLSWLPRKYFYFFFLGKRVILNA